MEHLNPMTDGKKEIIWMSWRAGFPMSRIEKEINKPPATVFSYLQYRGGIEPRPRHRAVDALDPVEMGAISSGLSAGESMRSLALMLGRCPSTISREINKDGGVLTYRAVDADKAAGEMDYPRPGVFFRR